MKGGADAIPVFGSGTVATTPQIAVVGDVPEVIVPLNDNPRSKETACLC